MKLCSVPKLPPIASQHRLQSSDGPETQVGYIHQSKLRLAKLPPVPMCMFSYSYFNTEKKFSTTASLFLLHCVHLMLILNVMQSEIQEEIDVELPAAELKITKT